MRIGTPVGLRKARIEIIPLIDIMFFLLASFMIVSLKMIHVQSLKMDLPTAAVFTSKAKPEMVNIEVDSLGDPYVDNQRHTLDPCDSKSGGEGHPVMGVNDVERFAARDFSSE